MKNYCYLNGKIVENSSAGIPLQDIGVIRGYGVFDSLLLNNGKPFLYEEHYDRLVRSGKELGLTVPISKKKMLEVINVLTKKNKMNEAAVRTVLTGGFLHKDGYRDSSFFILFEEAPKLPASTLKNGGKLITYNHQRIVPTAKTTNYITYIQKQNEQKRKKAVEILYTSNGNVLECATSNFFLIKGNTLVTAKKDVLIGITRNLVIKLAKKVGLKVEERNVSTKELITCDEAFITASFKLVCPIVNIDGKKISKGKVGEKTKLLMSLFEKELNK